MSHLQFFHSYEKRICGQVSKLRNDDDDHDDDHDDDDGDDDDDDDVFQACG